MEKSDETLMLECRQGSSEALGELFGRYKLKVFNFACRILADRAEAEDVTADLFLTLLTHRGAYEPRAKFSTWAYTVVRNRCISKIRKRRRWVLFSSQEEESEEEAAGWQVADTSPGPAEQLQREDASGRIQAAVRRLPLPQREALVLREYHGLSYSEIGETLGRSLENVKVLIFRAREALRKELAPMKQEGLQ